jgi:PAS domain S-box-containing protein
LGLYAVFAAWHGRAPHSRGACLVAAFGHPFFDFSIFTLIWRASRRPGLGPAGRRSARLMSAGFLLVAATDLAVLHGHARGVPSAAAGPSDVLHVLALALLVASMVSFTYQKLKPAERSRFGLDIATVMVASAVPLWSFVLRPIGLASCRDPARLALALVYPTADLILAFGLVYILFRCPEPRMRPSLVALAGGGLLHAVADLEISVGRLAVAPAVPAGAIAATYLAAKWSLASGAWLFARGAAASPRVASLKATRPGLFRFLPYLAVTAGYAVLAVLAGRGPAAPFADVVLGTASLTALVFARQALTLRENRRLVAESQALTAELRQSEERHRALYEDNPSMYFTVAPSGVVLSVNRFGAEQLGYRADDLVGRPLLGVIAEADKSAVLAHLSECLANPGRTLGWELRKVRKDGSLLWVKEAARSVLDRDRALVVLIVCEDVTPRKRAEEAEARLHRALERAAREWEQTFDSIEAPILILDDAGRIVRLNRAAKELSGAGSYPRLLGRAVAEAGSGQPWEKAGELAAEIAAGGLGRHVQVPDESNGRTWDVAASAATRLEGQDERVIVVARDITPMVQLQESLRRSETMSVLGSVVAGVAHEVRNPLFGISTNVDAFEARFGRRKEYRETIAALREGVGRLVGLMNELLDYGRPAQKAPTLETLSAIVARAVESCSGLARSCGVEVTTDLPGNLSPIAVDRDRIVQVFQNLIENATQHTPRGGTVRIEGRETRHGNQHFVECSVTDSGPGFRDEDLPRLFEPFFTRRQGGTGLGLSIVQRIVDLHGGSITAANRPEGGAVMHVRFPLSAPDPRPERSS